MQAEKDALRGEDKNASSRLRNLLALLRCIQREETMCDHILIKCPECRTIITQCRCIEADKTVKFLLCNNCKKPKGKVGKAPGEEAPTGMRPGCPDLSAALTRRIQIQDAP